MSIEVWMKLEYKSGNFIEISDARHEKLSELEDYIEEKHHLIDEKV